MFKLRIYCNDGNESQYWEYGNDTYETYDKALIACYKNAIDETVELMSDPHLLGWFEVYSDFEITEVYETNALKDIVFFPVATIFYDHAPWDRDHDCDIKIVTGYDIVEVEESVNENNT